MSQQLTRRDVLIGGISGLTLALGIVGCSQEHSRPAATATTPATDPLASDVLTTDVADIDGSAKRGVWAKKMSVDNGFCTIKAAMAIVFNQDQSPNDPNAYSGTFDIWTSTDSETKPHLHQGFEVYDATGKLLFKLGPFGGFEMPSAVNYHHWIGYFDYPKASYAQIAKCTRSPSTCKE